MPVALLAMLRSPKVWGLLAAGLVFVGLSLALFFTRSTLAARTAQLEACKTAKVAVVADRDRLIQHVDVQNTAIDALQKASAAAKAAANAEIERIKAASAPVIIDLQHRERPVIDPNATPEQKELTLCRAARSILIELH